MSASRNSIFEAVRRTICNVLCIGTESVTLDTTIDQLPGIESGDLLQIRFELEKQFGFDIFTDAEAQELHERKNWANYSVDNIIGRIVDKIPKAA